MQHNYLIWVPTTAFDSHPALYSSFYIFEMLMICAQLLAEPFIVYRMYSTRPLHRNIRLIIACCLSFTGLSSISRLILLYFQYTGIPTPGTGSATVVLLASLGREVGLGVLVAIPFDVAAERMVATRHWSWYEKELSDTLWVFGTILVFSVFVALLNGVCYIYGIYHELGNIVAFALGVSLGVLALGYVYYLNIGLKRRISLGARIEGYSVAHTYQIRENLAVIKFLFKLVIPAIIFAGPSFIAFSTYMFLPAIIPPAITDADYYRHIAVAMFDIFVEGFYVSFSAFLWYFVPKLRPHRSRLPTPNSAQDANQYFDWLTRDLNRMSELRDTTKY